MQSIYMVQGFPFALAYTYITHGHKDVYTFCKSNFFKILFWWLDRGYWNSRALENCELQSYIKDAT